MSKELGDTFKLDTLFVKGRCEGMPESMAVNVPAAEVLLGIFLNHVVPGAPVPADERRFRFKILSMFAKVFLDEGLKIRRKGDDPLPASLAGDADETSREVDVTHLETAHLGNPEPGQEHDRETEAMAIPPDVFQKNFNFLR
ncbi:MAG TPA: hypothetical protein PKM65_20040 [Spirochaetota bacterium]|nr:hypothetical protein [Spirochaetota bacterium]HNT13136.1 hypothetical protein [Spirochaetota bacterium]